MREITRSLAALAADTFAWAIRRGQTSAEQTGAALYPTRHRGPHPDTFGRLVQAYHSGVLSYDDYRSLCENAPRLVGMLRAGLNLTAAQMREKARRGEITAALIDRAMRS